MEKVNQELLNIRYSLNLLLLDSVNSKEEYEYLLEEQRKVKLLLIQLKGGNLNKNGKNISG